MAEEKRVLTKYEGEKIKEENLNKQEMEISIYSPMFAAAVADIDRRIKSCIAQVNDDDFEKGRITAVIDIMVDEKEATTSITSNTNQAKIGKYNAPHIKTNITLSLTRKDQVKSDVSYEKHELIEQPDGTYKAVPIKDAQVTLEETMQQQKIEE